MIMNLRKEGAAAGDRDFGPMVRAESHFEGHGGRLVRCFSEREANLDELFSRAVSRSPEAEAVVDGTRRISYRALGDRVEQVDMGLRKLGIMKGDRLAFAVGNGLEFIELLLGCARRGVIAVPLNMRMRRREIAHVLNDSGAVALVVDDDLVDQVPSLADAPTCRCKVVIARRSNSMKTYEEVFSGHDEVKAVVAASRDEDVAAIVYTSGTTGSPKGAAITHLGLIHTVRSFEGCAELRAGERTVLAVPASHITGIAAVIYPVLHLGGCVVTMRNFSAEGFAALAAAESCTYAFLVPAMANLLMLRVDIARHDLSPWRVLAFGGAPMPPATIAAISRTLPRLQLLHAYGATETTAAVTGAMVPANVDSNQVRSIGRALPCADVRIMDENGCEVPCGKTGELWIGGPSVIPFYWGRAVGQEALAGGYWRSGDIGWVDAAGFIFIGDRKKDMINRAGFKIYSVEVESVLMSHPHVEFASVVGRPDPVLGEKSHAFLIAKPDADVEEIRRFCAGELSNYKVPDAFSIVEGDDLPRNAAGKVLKAELRERLKNRQDKTQGQNE